MKLIHIISGVLLFLLIAVSSASAQEFHLTTVNDHTYDGKIDIKVTVDGTTITVQDVSPALNGVSNVDVKAIGIVNPVDNPVTSVTDESGAGSTWTHTAGTFNRAGFGDFTTFCEKGNKIKTRGPIKLTLQNPIVNLPTNTDGNNIIVHISFGQENKDVLVGSTWVGGSIPEFPTVALPVAAILGLMFILQRRKEN